MDNSDLIKKYGGVDTSGEVIQSSNADLINKYSESTVKAIPETPIQTSTGTVAVPQGQAAQVPSNYVPAGAPVNGMQEYRDPNAAPYVAPEKPIEISQLPIVRQGIEGFKSGAELAGSGYSDIAKGLSATGVGKVALGHTQQILNLTGISPTIEEGTEQLTKITGNPEFAKRAELVVTSGLPIAKVGSVATATMPTTRALKTLVETIGPENIPTAIAQLKSNPRLTLADVDPNVQIVTQGLAAKPGEPRNILDKFVTARNDSQKDVVTNIYDEAMGVPVPVRDKVEALKTQIKDTGKEINPVIKNSGPIDISPVLTSIDQKLNPGVQSVITAGEPLPLDDIQKSLSGVRKLLTDDKSVRTDPQSLHNFQSALRAKAEDLLSSANGQDRQLGYALMNVRNQIVDAIDKASPQITKADGTITGSYKPALAKYRDVNDINDAFKKGQLVTRNRLGNLEDDPSYWDNWIKTATPAELEAAKEGARLAVAHQMGSVTNAARKGMNIPDVEFNAEKLKLLFGNKEVEIMQKALNDEKKIADTNSKLFQNSQTAMRTLGAEATKVRPDYEPKFTKTILPVALEAGTQYLSGGQIPLLGLSAGLAYPFARSKITKIGQNLDRSTNVEIANLASATGEARENLIKALQEHIPAGKLTMKQRLQLSLPVQKP